MKMPLRILLILLCAALIIALPFTISAPNMLNDVKMELMNEEDEEDEIDFGRLFVSTAYAEGETEEFTEDEDLDANEEKAPANGGYTLALDFSVPPAPKAENFTADGYEDETISVKIEHREMDDGTKMHVAYIKIADASQLRTGVANPEKIASNKTKTVSTMAKKFNAVIAINGDNYADKPDKTTFEYRMTQKVRSKGNKQKDILIIDDQGDFHLYVRSQGLETGKKKNGKNVWMKAEEWEAATGRKLVNAFTFGPALVRDGELLELNPDYGYNPGGREPRAAIGQTGPLSYVMVIIEAKDRSGKSGFSQGKLAEFMYELGCVQAFNLDGGNSAEMVCGEQVIKGMPNGDERTLSDIIYFATAKP